MVLHFSLILETHTGLSQIPSFLPRQMMARSSGHVDTKENCHISSSEIKVECEDIQGKAAGGNAVPLRKENRKLSPVTISFYHNYQHHKH